MPTDVAVQDVEQPAFEAGDRLRLTHPAAGHAVELLVEPCAHGVLLALPEQPYHRLHLTTQKAVASLFFRPTKGHAAATWQIIVRACGDERMVRIRSGLRGGEFLGIDHAGAWSVCREPFDWRQEGGAPAPSLPLGTADAARTFERDGYCMMRGLVPLLALATRRLRHTTRPRAPPPAARSKRIASTRMAARWPPLCPPADCSD